MKDSYSEIKNTILHFCEDIDVDDFAEFHLHRLVYETTESLVRLYNQEIDIGITGEKLQILYFIIFHKLFIRNLGKSPIVLSSETKSVQVKGKISLTNNGFEFQNESRSFLKLV
ncbi:hypothetical protein [Myroides sp. C20-1]|uniref:hypothetical protein n=1 Tax=Myroides sp. C20-1 TaxID=3400534 RepID=UPI003D2F69A2